MQSCVWKCVPLEDSHNPGVEMARDKGNRSNPNYLPGYTCRSDSYGRSIGGGNEGAMPGKYSAYICTRRYQDTELIPRSIIFRQELINNCSVI